MPLVNPVINRVFRRASHGILSRGTGGRTYTNLFLQSINQNSASWSAAALTSRLRDAVAPDGVANTATTMVETNTLSNHGVTQIPSPAVAANQILTMSCWVKRGEGTRNFSLLLLGSGGANFSRQFFNLTTGVVGTSQLVGNGIIINKGIKAFPNSWYRIWVTGKHSTTVALGDTRFEMNEDETTSYTGDGTSSILIWGAQLQTDAAPSNLIRTTTTRLTQEETENIYGN